MDAIDFVKTIYLGDRACKKFDVDKSGNCVRIQIDCISRVRSESGECGYYVDEDILDGYIVFCGVKNIEFNPQNIFPNDFIDIVEVSRVMLAGDCYVFRFIIEAGYVDNNGDTTIVSIKIDAYSIHLEDPLKTGLEIYD